MRTADAELARYFESVLSSALPREDDPLLPRVRDAIRDGLLHGTPSAHDVARRLGLGHRTLQRRLAQRGVSFAETLESTRRDLADAYLRDASLSLAEIAYLLGYKEQGSFFRAFRRWHGQTPASFRRSS